MTAADYLGDAATGTGLQALRHVDLFNLLCVPPDVPDADTATAVYVAALSLCVEQRAVLLVDPPARWNAATTQDPTAAVTALGLAGGAARNAALYFPRLLQHQPGLTAPLQCVPCGAVAGVIARTDAHHGVWKAPADSEAGLSDVLDVAVHLGSAEVAALNRVGINTLRRIGTGPALIWGARTLGAADASSAEYKYLPVRRTALHIEQSVVRGIAWAVSEANNEALWAQLRVSVGEFLGALFRQGAFQGSTAGDAYFVRCDAQTTSADDLRRGLCNLLIGFAPLKPAEFVLLRIAQQTALPGR